MEFQRGHKAAWQCWPVDVARIAEGAYVEIILVAVENVEYPGTGLYACRVKHLELICEFEIGIEKARCGHGAVDGLSLIHI